MGKAGSEFRPMTGDELLAETQQHLMSIALPFIQGACRRLARRVAKGNPEDRKRWLREEPLVLGLEIVGELARNCCCCADHAERMGQPPADPGCRCKYPRSHCLLPWIRSPLTCRSGVVRALGLSAKAYRKFRRRVTANFWAAAAVAELQLPLAGSPTVDAPGAAWWEGQSRPQQKLWKTRIGSALRALLQDDRDPPRISAGASPLERDAAKKWAGVIQTIRAAVRRSSRTLSELLQMADHELARWGLAVFRRACDRGFAYLGCVNANGFRRGMLLHRVCVEGKATFQAAYVLVCRKCGTPVGPGNTCTCEAPTLTRAGDKPVQPSWMLGVRGTYRRVCAWRCSGCSRLWVGFGLTERAPGVRCNECGGTFNARPVQVDVLTANRPIEPALPSSDPASQSARSWLDEIYESSLDNVPDEQASGESQETEIVAPESQSLRGQFWLNNVDKSSLDQLRDQLLGFITKQGMHDGKLTELVEQTVKSLRMVLELQKDEFAGTGDAAMIETIELLEALSDGQDPAEDERALAARNGAFKKVRIAIEKLRELSGSQNSREDERTAAGEIYRGLTERLQSWL